MSMGDGWEIPEEEKPSAEFRWWKIKGLKSLVLTMLSDKPLWYIGHYTKGRMQPCYGEGCLECKKGTGKQVRYVVIAGEFSTHNIGLLEVGESVARDLKEMADRRGMFKGLTVEMVKHSWSSKSRMEVTFCDIDPGSWIHEVDIPDIKRALELTWLKMGLEPPKKVSKAPSSWKEKKFSKPDIKVLGNEG